MINEPVRKYIYSLLVPVAALLVVYGILDSETVTLWIGVGAALLGIPVTELARSKVTPVGKTTGEHSVT